MYDDCVLLSMRFPQKLWRIVNECKTGAIHWSVHGGTILLDYKKFQDEYLDSANSIFKTNNITSFIRQLNLYGFRKVTSHNRDPMCNSHNPDIHEFLHENFRVGRIDLLTKVCRKIGGGKVKYCDRLTLKHSFKREYAEKEMPRMTRLQMCQFALTEALEQATRDYHQEKFWEEAINDDPLADIANSQEAGNVGAWISNLQFGLGKNRPTAHGKYSSVESGVGDDTSEEECDSMDSSNEHSSVSRTCGAYVKKIPSEESPGYQGNALQESKKLPIAQKPSPPNQEEECRKACLKRTEIAPAAEQLRKESMEKVFL